jgi:hypothetical protein
MITSVSPFAVVVLSSDGRNWHQLLPIATDFTGRWRQSRPSLLRRITTIATGQIRSVAIVKLDCVATVPDHSSETSYQSLKVSTFGDLLAIPETRWNPPSHTQILVTFPFVPKSLFGPFAPKSHWQEQGIALTQCSGAQPLLPPRPSSSGSLPSLNQPNLTRRTNSRTAVAWSEQAPLVPTGLTWKRLLSLSRSSEKGDQK